jgi:hypothetical protein
MSLQIFNRLFVRLIHIWVNLNLMHHKLRWTVFVFLYLWAFSALIIINSWFLFSLKFVRFVQTIFYPVTLFFPKQLQPFIIIIPLIWTWTWFTFYYVGAWRIKVFLAMTKVYHFLLNAPSCVDLTRIKTIFWVLIRQSFLMIRYNWSSIRRYLRWRSRYLWRCTITVVLTLTQSWKPVRWWCGTIQLTIHFQLLKRWRPPPIIILFHLDLHERVLWLLLFLIFEFRIINVTLIRILYNFIIFIGNLTLVIKTSTT